MLEINETRTIAPNLDHVAQQSATTTPMPPDNDDGKHWYESKTIWFNFLFILVSLVTYMTPALEQYMSAETYSVLASGVAFINAVLRLATGQPIKGRLSE